MLHAVAPLEAVRNYPSLNIPTQSLTMHFPQVYAGERPFPEAFPKHANQMHTHISSSTHVNQQAQPNPMQTQMPPQMVPEPFHSMYPSSVMRGAQRDVVPSASHPPYHPGLYDVCWSSLVASNPSWPLRSQSSDGYMFPSHVSQDSRGPRNPPPNFVPSAHQLRSHETYSHYPLASATNNHGVAHPPHLAPQLHTPELNWRSHSTSSSALETGQGLRFVPPQEWFHRKRRVRAIEYAGLWLDEEELLEGQKEPDGKLSVHQCFWDEDRTPCHLWVKNDRSSISVHIQRWHGGKRGGDKLEAECRWSGCGSTMLKESIARHILGIHLKERWVCQGCGKGVTRKDAYAKHAVESDFVGCQIAGPSITYSADVREIDARAALNSGGRLRYANV